MQKAYKVAKEARDWLPLICKGIPCGMFFSFAHMLAALEVARQNSQTRL
ncbi:hypothetical protein [uncultured Ligilactobacillus sp.]|nr:hypothetical protein [uncultured Ligilactobacillus sp.]